MLIFVQYLNLPVAVSAAIVAQRFRSYCMMASTLLRRRRKRRCCTVSPNSLHIKAGLCQNRLRAGMEMAEA